MYEIKQSQTERANYLSFKNIDVKILRVSLLFLYKEYLDDKAFDNIE
jgi:hypothetical protein